MKRPSKAVANFTGIRLTLTCFAVVTLMLAAAGLWIPDSWVYGQQRNKDSRLQFSEHLIARNYAYPYGIAAADLDGDGDLDLTSADFQPHSSVYFFENNGQGNFKPHFIQKNDPKRIERHMTGDIDRDGHPDIVIVKNFHGDLLWFRNSGAPTNGKLWERHVITTQLPGAYDVTLGDFDGDGDLDVAGSGWVYGNQFAWFENDGTPADGEWKKYLIEGNLAETRGIRTGDIDGDGDPDLLGAATGAGQVIWYENGGQPAVTGWRKHIIEKGSPRPGHGQPVDMDGDGDLDVVMALGMIAAKDEKNTHHVVWYENNGKPGAGPWKKHVVGPNFFDAFEAVASDLDSDGDVDVVASSWRKPGRVAWFENHGDPKGSWTTHVLKDNWQSANQVIIADLNGDGRPDIAAVAEHGSYEFRWWRNEGQRGSK